MLNLDFVNLGFSGNGKGEPEVARAVPKSRRCLCAGFRAEQPDGESLRAVYEPFVNTIRENIPGTQIFVITPISSAREMLPIAGSTRRYARAHPAGGKQTHRGGR